MERQLKPFPMPPSQTPPETPQKPDYNPLSPKFPVSVKSVKSNRWMQVVTLLIIVLAVIVSGVYLLHKHQPKTPTSTSSHQIIKPDNVTNQTNTVQYVSNGQDLNLDFSYPTSWTVSPPTNDNANDQTITVTSPLLSIQNTGGSTVTGKVVLNIRPGSAQLSELASGNATAAQNSIQIGYTQPLASQQQYPYLSFINLNSGSNPSGGFQEVFITGMLQLTQGENITAADLSSLDPYISASFYSCSTQACSGAGETPLSISLDTWQNTSPFTQTLAIIQSIQLH
jgi:hypothetical protein